MAVIQIGTNGIIHVLALEDQSTWETGESCGEEGAENSDSDEQFDCNHVEELELTIASCKRFRLISSEDAESIGIFILLIYNILTDSVICTKTMNTFRYRRSSSESRNRALGEEWIFQRLACR